MTRQRTDDGDTPFGAWLRNNRQLPSSLYDAENLDYVWFAYRSGNLMLIEEKCYMSEPSPAQKDTHGIVDQALRFACGNMEFKRLFASRTPHITYHGYHLLQFENTSPLDGKIFWDGQEISEEELVNKLCFR